MLVMQADTYLVSSLKCNAVLVMCSVLYMSFSVSVAVAWLAKPIVHQCVHLYVLWEPCMSYVSLITTLPDYQPALSLVSSTANFSERLSTLTYSFQESCSLYPRCTPYFSVEHTVSPQSVVSNTSSGCSVEYTILNLTRCVSYQSTATALLGNQTGNTVVTGITIMLSEWGGRASRLDTPP